MSNSLDSFTGSTNPLIENQDWHDRLRKQYPTLADALLGNEHTRKEGPVRPPFTLMLRAKAGKLQAMLSSQECSKTWFSPGIDPEAVLDAIELALAEGLGEWIQKPNDRSGRRS